MRSSSRVATLALLGPFAAAAVEGAGARAYVLDSGAPALVSLDLASGQRLATLPLTGTPTWLVRARDGRHLVALDDGPGESKGIRGYKAHARSSATIVEVPSLRIVGRVELGFGLDSVLTDPEGRLVALCPGYDAKNPAESLPRELVIVDLAAARERGRLPLEPGTDLSWQSRDGRMLALLQGLPRTQKYPFPASKVTLVDATGPSVTGTLDAGGWDQVERDADRLYLVVLGKPDKNPQKDRNGTVDVISLADRRVERVDIGRGPTGGCVMEGGLMAIASQGSAGGASGELRFLRDGKLAVTLPVAARPMWVAPVAGALHIVGSKAVTLVDPASLEETATIPLAKGPEAIVDDDDQPFEVVATADGRRAFIHYPAQDKVALIDLEQKKAIGSTKTGRGGKKLLNNMMSGLTYGLSGRVYFYRPGDPPQMLVRPDGRFAYALNLDTSDVTVIDAETAQAVEKISAGGRSLAFLGGPTLVVLGPELHFVDATRNAKVDQVPVPGLMGLWSSPDRATAVALAERSVVILDGLTGKVRARLTGFVKPTRIAFAEAVSLESSP